MGFFGKNYDKPGPGIAKDIPMKKGLPLFFEIFFREFFELFKLNLIFILFCLPIITIPAAITAMSRLTLTMIRDRNHFLWSDFLEAFKADFKKSTICGLLLFAGLVTALISVSFYSAAVVENSFFYLPFAISCLLVFLISVMGFYLFPMIALIDLPMRQLLKNAMLLAIVCLFPNLAAAAIVGVVLFFFIGYFPVSIPAVFVHFFALLNFITTFCAYAGIKRYVIREQGQSNGESCSS